MKVVLLAMLCLFVGACATVGVAQPNTYGTYDVVSVNGEPLPHAIMTEGSYELRANGTSVYTIQNPSNLAPVVSDGTFSLGAFSEGCIPFTGTNEQGSAGGMTGSICSGVFLAEGGDYSIVMHKRN